jgi:hypothetical protein
MKNITFKSDDTPLKVGNDVRVEVELPDGLMLVVVLTHEGIITDLWENEEHIATSSRMYSETADDLLDNP